PNLVRLNPNVPFRTRGNGAVALRFEAEQSEVDDVAGILEDSVVRYSELDYPNTNPGIVVLAGSTPETVRRLAEAAMWRLVPLSLAKRVVERERICHIEKGNGRGLVGALSAIGNDLSGDHTFEYLAYRSLDRHTRHRGVDPESVALMDRLTRGRTYSNIDPETGTVLVEPHGPDPVIFGIRGETSIAVREAARMVKTQDHIERWMIFRTNQGTGAHLVHEVPISDLRPYMAATVVGEVRSTPRMIEGGHVVFRLGDENGTIDCAAYEPTASFRNHILRLWPGDRIALYAGVRPASRLHGPTLNIEGMKILSVVPRTQWINPLCICGHRMKSAGTGKGFKCEKCGRRNTAVQRTELVLNDPPPLGLYLPPPRAQRHLSRPYSRLALNNEHSRPDLTIEWHSP
ncbi:MAG: tRNA(Ile)(2)-agmatinylcytidine synthase, partial [Candidatus Thorarchaeota archaeon]